MPCDRPRRAVVARHRLGEPAERAGAEPAQHDAGLPRLAQRDVEPVGAQHAHQADHAAAADVDEVLLEQVRAHVVGPAVAPEQRDVRGLAAARREVAVEADDVVVGVAGRRGEEADLRPVAARRRCQPEHVVVQERVPGFHREPAATEGDDLAWARHGVKVGTAPAPCANFMRAVEPPGPRVGRASRPAGAAVRAARRPPSRLAAEARAQRLHVGHVALRVVEQAAVAGPS